MQKIALSEKNPIKLIETNNQPDILIFKTNVKTAGDRFYIKKFLDQNPLIQQWSIDLEDADCVLRVVSTHLEPSEIIIILNNKGYCCQELLY